MDGRGGLFEWPVRFYALCVGFYVNEWFESVFSKNLISKQLVVKF